MWFILFAIKFLLNIRYRNGRSIVEIWILWTWNLDLIYIFFRNLTPWKLMLIIKFANKVEFEENRLHKLITSLLLRKMVPNEHDICFFESLHFEGQAPVFLYGAIMRHMWWVFNISIAQLTNNSNITEKCWCFINWTIFKIKFCTIMANIHIYLNKFTILVEISTKGV